jgi:hypothetical protein
LPSEWTPATSVIYSAASYSSVCRQTDPNSSMIFVDGFLQGV